MIIKIIYCIRFLVTFLEWKYKDSISGVFEISIVINIFSYC